MSWIRHILARLAQIVTLGRVQATTASAGTRATVAARVLGDDESVPWIQPYGLQSRPPAGASAVLLAPGGSSDDAVCILIGDRSILQALSEGDVALVDSDGQRIHMLPGDSEIHVVPTTKVILGGTAATSPIAAFDDVVERNASFSAWMTAVEGFINAASPGTVTPLVGDEIGALAQGTGSAVTHRAYLYRAPSPGEG